MSPAFGLTSSHPCAHFLRCPYLSPLDILLFCARVGRWIGGVEVEVTGFINASEMLRSGVYMLVRAGEVVYIGQAKAMIVRVCTHRSNARKTLPSWMPPSAKGIIFDEVLIRPCPVHLLDSLEYDLINLYKPRHNIALKHNGKSTGEVTITVRGTAVVLNRKPEPTLIERRI